MKLQNLMLASFAVAISLLCFSNHACAQADTAAKPKQPNIVFIFSDDLTTQAISCYGEKRKLLQTPNMDSIARDGMLFNRCLVTNSICGPSRATILTGKYSHLNGFYNNTNSVFDGSQVTFPKMLQAAGYQTAIVGKWHLMSDPTGFDYWHILPGQGVYYNPPMIDNGKRVKHEGYVTDIITDLSIQWLDQRDKSKPFVMMMQHKAPHREWEPALRHLNWNDDKPFAEPDNLFDDFDGRGLPIKDHDMGISNTMTERDLKLVPPKQLNESQLKEWNAYYEPRNAMYKSQSRTPEQEVQWRYQRYMHDYLGCIKSVDESVGRMLKYLDDSGLAENTIVICSSDQGFFLGEHGWFDKRWIFEESARTPLMIKWPGHIQPGGKTDAIVSLMDFAPTFCELAGVQPTSEMQGRSILPILEGKQPDDWRKSLYYHYYEFPVPHRVRPHYGLITDRYKLIHYYAPDVDEWELLDRQADPSESKSFYNDPKYAEVRQQLHEELKEKRAEAKDTQPTPATAYGNPPKK